MRFIERHDDYYLDTKTGIRWSRETLNSLRWDNSMTLDVVGWRLPTIEELLTLVDYTIYNPATKLPGMFPSYYWSSTPSTDNKSVGHAWSVGFYCGHSCSNDKSNAYYIRLVKEL